MSFRETTLRWTILHPDHWTKNEVEAWLKSVLEKNNISGNDKYSILEAFDDVSGSELVKMSLERFKDLDQAYGELLHKTFRELLPVHSHFTKPFFEGESGSK